MRKSQCILFSHEGRFEAPGRSGMTTSSLPQSVYADSCTNTRLLNRSSAILFGCYVYIVIDKSLLAMSKFSRLAAAGAMPPTGAGALPAYNTPTSLQAPIIPPRPGSAQSNPGIPYPTYQQGPSPVPDNRPSPSYQQPPWPGQPQYSQPNMYQQPPYQQQGGQQYNQYQQPPPTQGYGGPQSYGQQQYQQPGHVRRSRLIVCT